MSDSDNRRHTRVPVPDATSEVVVHIQNGSGVSDTRTVRVQDLSRTGLGFASKNPLPLGTRCIVALRHLQTPLRVVGQVTNCRPSGETAFLIGIKFTSIAPVTNEDPGHSLTDDPSVGRLMINL